MKTIFADTGYWVAVLNPRDSLHEKAQATLRALYPVRLLTSQMVLDELLAALRDPPVRAAVIEGVKAILSDPNVEVVPQTSIQFLSAFDLYVQRPDKDWSLTDCASFQ